MKKLEAVEQISDEKLRWKAQVFWSHRSWESTILEQVQDERIVWRSKGDRGVSRRRGHLPRTHTRLTGCWS